MVLVVGALGLLVAFICLGAWSVGYRTAWARIVTMVCAVGAIITPAFVPGPPLLRFGVATAGTLAAFRSLDLTRDRRHWPLHKRLWLATSMLDIRRLRPTPARLSARGLALTLVFAALAAGGYALAFRIAPTTEMPQLVRWLGGVLFIYGVADTFNHGATTLFCAFGQRPPRLHHAPVLALSVGAFWSRHYNLSVSAWLGRHFHRPWARRGRPRLGLALAFIVSAAFHAWLAFVPLDATMAALMGVFFLVQAVAIFLEQRLGQAHWPRAARHIWTATWMLGSAPLFVEPFLRIMTPSQF